MLRGFSPQLSESSIEVSLNRKPNRYKAYIDTPVKNREKKVTVVGAGNVGATAAQRLAEKALCDVVLVDIIEGVPQGKALDLTEAAPIEKHDAHLVGSNEYDASKGSDVVIITAGIPRKPGMSRDDLLKTNAGIMKDVTQKIAKLSPEAVLIIVSNPPAVFPRTESSAWRGFSILLGSDRLLPWNLMYLLKTPMHLFLADMVIQWFRCRGILLLQVYRLPNSCQKNASMRWFNERQTAVLR
jgi:hypothetical protein